MTEPYVVYIMLPAAGELMTVFLSFLFTFLAFRFAARVWDLVGV